MSRLSVFAAALFATLVGGCALPQVTMPEIALPQVSVPERPALFQMPPQRTPFANIPYANWQDQEPAYRFYPGDVIDVAVPSAPELNRSVTVAPDGRISLPLIAPMMASDRTVPELQYMLSQAYSAQLTRPQVELTVKQSAPLKIFVGGEVDKPGVYDMPGDVNALQAVLMAGGAKATAKLNQTIVIRRGFNDQAELRTVDLRKATFAAGSVNAVPLRRGDLVIVPRSTIATIDLFIQQYLRDDLPVQFTYALSPTQYINTR